MKASVVGLGNGIRKTVVVFCDLAIGVGVLVDNLRPILFEPGDGEALVLDSFADTVQSVMPNFDGYVVTIAE
ncbi:hypothetical protein [Natronorubrum halophilum]|uniref:hypothetical protein n=1 Tax=Natronorubrum halophilum TaxID=1702106 RepID=UPI0010C1CE76|nr:hypothetical protein [Natronorubrum halophilum]